MSIPSMSRSLGTFAPAAFSRVRYQPTACTSSLLTLTTDDGNLRRRVSYECVPSEVTGPLDAVLAAS
jgi:hypothetical protein